MTGGAPRRWAAGLALASPVALGAACARLTGGDVAAPMALDAASAVIALLGVAAAGLSVLAARLRLQLASKARIAEVLQKRVNEQEAARATRQLEASKLMERAKNELTRCREAKTELEATLEGATRLTVDQARELDSLRARVPKERLHDVLLDGMSGAGKSTLMARFVSPVMRPEEIEDIVSTPTHYASPAAPVCWLRDDERVVLHSVRFWDIAGEKGSTFLDALDELKSRRGKDAAVDDGTPVTLLIVWDVSDRNRGKNSLHLNQTRMQMAYGNMKAREFIQTVIVFFNKADTLPPDRVLETVETERREIEQVFRESFEGGYGDLHFFHGSARYGAGVSDCLGALLRGFELEKGFTKVTGTRVGS